MLVLTIAGTKAPAPPQNAGGLWGDPGSPTAAAAGCQTPEAQARPLLAPGILCVARCKANALTLDRPTHECFLNFKLEAILTKQR